MPQFTIEATSEKAKENKVKTNTNKKFPSPAEFADQAAADANAKAYAKELNKEDAEGVWDWCGKATPV